MALFSGFWRWFAESGSSGTVGVTGTASLIESDDILAASGGVVVTGTLTATEAADLLVAVGGVAGDGASAVVDGTDTVTATGQVAVTPVASLTENSDSLLAIASSTGSAVALLFDSDDVLSGSGAVRASGTLSASDPPDQLSSTIGVSLSSGDPTQGTVVVAPVVPPTSEDEFPTHFDSLGRGGLIAVNAFSDLAAVTSLRRKTGMVASVSSTGRMYQLSSDLTTWEPLVGGASVSVGTIEYAVDFNTPTHTFYTLSAGVRVLQVEVLVSEVWDGAGCALSFGVPGSPEYLVATTDVDLTDDGVYALITEDPPTVTSLVVTVSPGVGATTGRAVFRAFTSV